MVKYQALAGKFRNLGEQSAALDAKTARAFKARLHFKHYAADIQGGLQLPEII
jgi:hypothetical protein